MGFFVFARARDTFIIPVLVTGLKHTLINKTNEEKAMKGEIAIVTINEISILFEMTFKDVSSVEVVNYISELVPCSIAGY